MYNLDHIVKMYYTAVSARMVLEETDGIKYNDFSWNEFVKLCKSYMPQYSDTEDQQLYSYAASSANEAGHPFSGRDGRSVLNVFAALEELAEQLLLLENNEVQCKYRNLLRFREVSKYVEEDLLVCAYLAMYYVKYGRINTDFGWNTTIGHNNLQLRRIMEKGISENHFHLYGSAPLFHLLWIHFMNHVDCNILSEFSSKIESAQRVTREHYSIRYAEDSFETRVLKAALIRICIMKYLLGEEIEDFDQNLRIREMLTGEIDIRAYYCEIQRMINHLQNYLFLINNQELIDYAVYKVEGIENISSERYWFAGERWMMHKMLLKELKGDAKKDAEYFQWFYAYLILKNNVRSEMLQVNDAVGFENFQIYTKRKKYYADYKKMIMAAIYGSIESGNIRSLEIRIAPRERASLNAENIWEINSIIKKIRDVDSRLSYYYVFHFLKSKDTLLKENVSVCRHYRLRRELEKQAGAIAAFREQYRKLASNVLGIDACSQEIGCRPEVFAPVFRFLSGHVVERVVGLEDNMVRQLRKTFHVGEDFLDVVDGLRAIDEAVHFLNLQCGDRIGHGTVLGIDVRKWYFFKQNTVLLSKQDYLDNVVWLYHKLTEYEIDGMDNLRADLAREFEKYFAEIFLYLKDGSVRENFYGDIHTYYEAWKLRGDEPELYRKGYFDKEEILDRIWFVNEKYPETYRDREHKKIVWLYYLYQYDYDVRYNGAAVIQVYVTPSQIEGVRLVQKAMQKEFSSLGIGIEANPSSNFAISTMQSYEEHPIITLYNNGITWDAERIKDCPQINISINTDDKGVFHTSLENEYALMACALEKVVDDRGEPVYNRQLVYQWIDNIREMGNMQSFQEKKNRKERKWKVRFKK